MPKNILARAKEKMSFAHLGAVAGKKGDEEEDKNRAEEEDDKKDQDREDGDAKGTPRNQSAEDDNPEDDDSEDKKDSKSNKVDDDEPDAEEDDDNEEEMRGNSAAAGARRRERARCAAIFGSRQAGRNPQLAASLAFNTSLTRKEAIAVLESTPAASPIANTARADRNPRVGSGGSLEANSSQAISARWDGHFKKMRGNR